MLLKRLWEVSNKGYGMPKLFTHVNDAVNCFANIFNILSAGNVSPFNIIVVTSGTVIDYWELND